MNRQNELKHYGVLGMKWGVRKDKTNTGYKSTSIRSALARRSNQKVDQGFKDWKENTVKRDNAIELGKKATASKIAYENNKSDKSLRDAYRQANKEYKKALRENTTYRKGVVKQEVGKDASRKYLSEAKKIKKQLDKNPNDPSLQKQYNKLMSKHDVERANARRAVEVSTNRMRKEAAIKRTMTMTVKAASTTAVVAAGTIAVNSYLSSHNVTLNGQSVRINSQHITKMASVGKSIVELSKYL